MLKVIHSNSNWHCNPNNSWRKWTTFFIYIRLSAHHHIRQLSSCGVLDWWQLFFLLSRMRWKKLYFQHIFYVRIYKKHIFTLSKKRKKRWWRLWCVSGVIAWVKKNKKTIKSNNACDTWKENICQWVWKIFPLVAAVEDENENNSIQLV